MRGTCVRRKIYRAKTGSENVLSAAPYGYRCVKKSEEAEARYEIMEHEARLTGIP